MRVFFFESCKQSLIKKIPGNCAKKKVIMLVCIVIADFVLDMMSWDASL